MKRLLILGAAVAVTAAIGCRTNDGDTQTAGTPPYTPPAATSAPATATTSTMTTATTAPTAPTATAAPSTDLSPRISNAPTTPTAATATPESATRISVNEAKQRIASGQAVVVDVRTAEAYRENHIPGAINIPYDQLKTRAGELPKDKYLVTYCT